MPVYLPDANILINALRGRSTHHQLCKNWLKQIGEREESLGLCDLVEVALLRIATLPNLEIAPVDEVMGFWMEDLLGYANSHRISPGPRHADFFSRFVTDLNLRGNDMNDAWLAALAVEQRATLVSLDVGFGRFPRLDWLNPQTDL